MKKKREKNGFIATSLIYAFFLAFIALLLTLIDNYLGNNQILSQYNSDVQDNLNNDIHNVIVLSNNPIITIQNGTSITNLISNGNFTNNFTGWTTPKSDDSVYTIKSYKDKLSVEVIYKQGLSGLYLYEDVNVIKDHKYYYSYEYAYNSKTYTPTISTYLYYTGQKATISFGTAGTWYKSNGLVTSNMTGESYFSVGSYESDTITDSSSSSTAYLYYTNIMLIDLTASFGADGEPTLEWLQNNVDYFDGTESLLQFKEVDGGDSVTFTAYVYRTTDYMSVICKNENNISVTPIVETTKSSDMITYKYTISSVASDITCTLDWSET